MGVFFLVSLRACSPKTHPPPTPLPFVTLHVASFVQLSIASDVSLLVFLVLLSFGIGMYRMLEGFNV